ncbi:MAG: hypothetical protein HY790_00935 [Deltaproteobacteria bacterium]|nr:hypothetical protein [Deltaproteobacteria bacterium]MBI4794407.1 hypothetical protein [Deltaproteobacteria bacterium]
MAWAPLKSGDRNPEEWAGQAKLGTQRVPKLSLGTSREKIFGGTGFPACAGARLRLPLLFLIKRRLLAVELLNLIISRLETCL